MKATVYASVVLNVFAALGAHGAEEHRSPEVVDCRHATMAKPGVGDQYKGAVSNEDYAFSVRIPTGLTAWSGVAGEAPFHGFTMFLDPKLSACIVFEIHVRVDESDKPAPPVSALPMSLGDASAWQSTSQSESAAGAITNIRTSFSFERSDQAADGEILLVAPTSGMPEARAVYDGFIRSLLFHRK